MSMIDVEIADLRVRQAALDMWAAEMGIGRASPTTDPIAAWEAAKAAQRQPGRTETQAILAAMATHPDIWRAAVRPKPARGRR
jgi:hypothetical protein